MSIFWFEKGELREIASKFSLRKWDYVLLAFYAIMWLGLLSLWVFKAAIQALNKQRFFDPLP